MSYQNTGNWTGAQVDALLNRANAAKQFHGFENRTDTTVAFDSSTHVFTLGVPSSATVWLGGTEYTLTEDLTVDFDDTGLAVGSWFVTISAPGGVPQLNASQTPWSISNLTYTPVAAVYWDGTVGVVQEERHGAQRNLELHSYLHHTVGSRIQNDGSFTQNRPTTTNDDTLELTAGSLWDEDILNEISTAQGKLCRLWYETASGVWKTVAGTDNGGYDRPFLWNGITSRVQYPNTGSSYALTDVNANDYIPVWVYATNDVDRPIYIVVPSLAAGYNAAADARDAERPSFPYAPEVKLLYRWIYKGDGNYIEGEDYRTSGSLPGAGLSSPPASTITVSTIDTLESTDVQAALEELALNTGVTIANLPGTPSTGMTARITDGDAALAWGATAVNSGSGATPYLVWYNGSNWTVVGK